MITKRIRPDLLQDVVDLENEDTLEIVTLEIPRYNNMHARGLTDAQIFNEIALAHDTPTFQELIDEHLPDWKLKRFAQGMART